MTAEQRTDCAEAVEAVPDLQSDIVDLKEERDELRGEKYQCKKSLKTCQLALKASDREVGRRSLGWSSTEVAHIAATMGGMAAVTTCYASDCRNLRDWGSVPVSIVGTWGLSKFLASVFEP